MNNIKIPPLLQMVRNAYDDPQKVHHEVVKSEKSRAPFSYQAIHKIVDQVIKFKTPLDEISYSIERIERRPFVLKQFNEVTPLLHRHFTDISPERVYSLLPLYYPLGKFGKTKFNPQMIYLKNGELFLPFINFWKFNPLSSEQKSLFLTLVDEILEEEPDLEDVNLQLIELSANGSNGIRTLKVVNTLEIERLDKTRTNILIDSYLTGLQSAYSEIATPSTQRPNRENTLHTDKRQRQLFE